MEISYLVVFEDSSKTLWVMTQGNGVNYIEYKHRDNKKFEFKSLELKSVIKSNTFYGMLEDEVGFLWVSSNRGLVRVNRNNKKVKVFQFNQYANASEFNQGAFFKTGKERMVFGRLNGV